MFGLLPKNLEFFECFDRAAKNALRAAEILAEFSSANGDRRRELMGAIKEKEHVGDNLTHETLDRLQRTYLTPIDREDIHALIVKIDDVVDYIDDVAQRMMFYKINDITPSFQNQCRVLVRAVEWTCLAIAGLRTFKSRSRKNGELSIADAIIKVHEAENEADEIHHHVLSELFDSGMSTLDIIKWKEVHEIVEMSIDVCEDIANIVHAIVLKNA